MEQKRKISENAINNLKIKIEANNVKFRKLKKYK